MKKVIVKNKLNLITHEVNFVDPTAWISDCVDNNRLGLPERWVPHTDDIDVADVLEEREVELEPAVPAKEEVLDSEGNVLEPAVEEVPAKVRKEVKLRAEYTIEIIDITEEVEQQKINAEALVYLASTDWMVIRELDAGTPMPEDVKAKRAEARAKIVR